MIAAALPVLLYSAEWQQRHYSSGSIALQGEAERDWQNVGKIQGHIRTCQGKVREVPIPFSVFAGRPLRARAG